MFVDDLCRAIPLLLYRHTGVDPVIVAPEENLSISKMVDSIKAIINPKVEVTYNNKLDGQYRKDGSNKLFTNLFPKFNFTSFEEGINKTYDWYKESVNKRSKKYL